LGAKHGLLVAGAHDDAIHIGDCCVRRVIFVERVIPHGGPKVIPFAPKQQFEDVGVEFVTVIGNTGGYEGPLGRVIVRRDITVFGADVAGQGWGFVVEKDAAIFDGRLAAGELAGFDVELGMFLGRHIGPVIPRRLAGFFREIVDTVDGAAFVGTADDQGRINPRQRLADHLYKIGFPFASDDRDIDLVRGDQLVDDLALADGTDDDHGAGSDFGAGDDPGRLAGDILDVIGEIVGRAEDTRPILRINVDRRRGVRVNNGETAGSRRELDVSFLTQSRCTLRG